MVHFSVPTRRYFIALFLSFFHLQHRRDVFTDSAGYIPHCRDPDLGGQNMLLSVSNCVDLNFIFFYLNSCYDRLLLSPSWNLYSMLLQQEAAPRKFLVITGVGAGIGNFLIFFPAAYYFAALTGREILIADDSLIGKFFIRLYVSI